MTPNHDITITAAFQTRDGKKFYDLAEAQGHTRDQKLTAQYSKLLRSTPEFARVPVDLFVQLMKVAATDAHEILTEPLDPVGREGKTIRPTGAPGLGSGYAPHKDPSADRPSNGDPTRPVDNNLTEAMRRVDRAPARTTPLTEEETFGALPGPVDIMRRESPEAVARALGERP